MSRVASASPPVNAMAKTELQRLTERAVGFNRAAQILADASRCRAGEPPVSLKQLPASEAVWYRQTAEQLIQIFEEITLGKPPAREEVPRLVHPREEAIGQERQRARLAATQRGHALSTFATVNDGFHDEQAACARCARAVRITVVDGPPLQVTHDGDAIQEGCLVAADVEGAR